MKGEHDKAWWEDVLKRQMQSGKTQKAFCQDEGIIPSSFRYWKTKQRTNDRTKEFIELPHARILRTSEIKMTLPSGIVIEAEANVSIDQLCTMLRAVMSL